MAGRTAILGAGLAAAALFTLAAHAAARASSPGGQSAASAGQSAAGSQSAVSGATAPDTAAQMADPARLIDPNMYATAIEVRETQHFGSITITPVDRSENSKALIRTVMQDQPGIEDLRNAIRANAQLMKALKDRGISVDDVVSVTTDRNDNAIVFVKG